MSHLISTIDTIGLRYPNFFAILPIHTINLFAFSVPLLLIVANNYCIIVLAMYLDPEMLCVVNWPCRRNVLILPVVLHPTM